MTLANVALPCMQGSLSTTQDQINWVLTSYIVAAAILTSPLGWSQAAAIAYANAFPLILMFQAPKAAPKPQIAARHIGVKPPAHS